MTWPQVASRRAHTPLERSGGIVIAPRNYMTAADRRAYILHRVFTLGIWLKGVDGVEMIGGVRVPNLSFDLWLLGGIAHAHAVR